MNKVSCRLTVFFENPFWTGVFERVSEGRVSVCKVIFASESKDYTVYAFIEKNYWHLRFSQAVEKDTKETAPNPKRIQREVRKQVKNTGIGTKSQQALKMQQEQLKMERKIFSKKRREEEQERKFQIKKQKRKKKHRGR